MIAILIFLSAISQIYGQSISGATSQCGGTGADPVTCGKATVLRGQSHIGIPAACFNKVDPGPCSQDLIRIYYDHTTYTCKAFSYSGCGGNANRFVSIKNCYKLCHPYYRQRFISLGTPNSGDDKAAPEKSDNDNDAATGSEEPTTEPTTEETTTEETTTTTEPTTTTEEDRGVLYFSSAGKDGPKTEVKPEIQVVHEYDTFAQPQPHPGYAPGPPPGQFPPAMGHPMGRSLAAGGAGGPAGSQHGYLDNIQHENYAPVGGYIQTGQGLAPNAQKQQQIVYTH